MAQEIADSTLLDTWASSGLKVEPDISKIIEGWQLGEQPPHEYMNWLQNTFGSKLNHILKNGVISWNNKTQYLAGSSVQHNGNVWLCKTTNTNSEPTDANTNWKRIITVESLTTVLAGYVALTGNQTIAGVKTFSANPISTATQGTEVNALTRKDYVDGLNTITSLTNKATPVDTDVIKIQETGGLFKKLTWANLKATLFNGAFSLTVNGYIKFPTVMGGLILQWGSAATTPTGVFVSFPIAFPTNIFNAQVSTDNSGPTIATFQTLNKNGMLLQSWSASSGGTQSGGQSVHYFAIGN